MPAAARSCRHHFGSYEKFKSSLSSKVIRRNYTPKSPARDGRWGKNVMSSNDLYSNINGTETSVRPTFANAEGPRTTVQSQSQHDVEEDGVHLTIEMQQTSQEKRTGEMNV